MANAFAFDDSICSRAIRCIAFVSELNRNKCTAFLVYYVIAPSDTGNGINKAAAFRHIHLWFTFIFGIYCVIEEQNISVSVIGLDGTICEFVLNVIYSTNCGEDGECCNGVHLHYTDE